MYIEKTKKFLADLYKYIAALWGKTASIKSGGRTRTIYPAKMFVALIVIVIIAAALVSLFSSSGGTDVLDIDAQTGSKYMTKQIGGDVLIYNNQGGAAVDSNGKIKWTIDETMSEPLCEADGDYLLLSDLSGKHFAASYKDGEKLQEFKLENDIISAKITAKGYCVFATDTDGYKAKVTVFNKRGKELYEWNSGSGYITDVDITDNGKYLAVSQLMTDGTSPDTRIQIIDTHRGETIASAVRSGEICAGMRFTSNNRLIVVTDRSITAYSARGNEKFNISLVGKSPSLYNIDSDDTIAVVTLDGRGNSVLELYSASGRLRGAYTASGDIKAISISGRGAIVAQQKGISRINARGKEKSTVNVAHDVKSIGYFGDKSRAVVIGSAKAEVINVK